jgi:hypothetical protein
MPEGDPVRMKGKKKAPEWRLRVQTSNQGSLKAGRQRKPMLGLTFGRLEVIAEDMVVYRMMQWVCRCSCGKTVTVPGANLRKGKTQSCGCLRTEKLVERWAKTERKPRKERAPRKAAARPAVKRKVVVEPVERKVPAGVVERKVPAGVVVDLRTEQVVVHKVVVVDLRRRLVMARNMRKGGARWSEVLEVTGLGKEEVEGV